MFSLKVSLEKVGLKFLDLQDLQDLLDLLDLQDLLGDPIRPCFRSDNQATDYRAVLHATHQNPNTPDYLRLRYTIRAEEVQLKPSGLDLDPCLSTTDPITTTTDQTRKPSL